VKWRRSYTNGIGEVDVGFELAMHGIGGFGGDAIEGRGLRKSGTVEWGL
jgi:hypothetical protein